jgi:hypothetical protein
MGMKITERRIAMMHRMNDEVKSIDLRDLMHPDGSAFLRYYKIEPLRN